MTVRGGPARTVFDTARAVDRRKRKQVRALADPLERRLTGRAPYT